MYSEHFGLRALPFEDRADAQFTFLTPEFEETLAALEYEVRYGKSAALILGEAGTGKTQLIRTFLARLQATDHVVVLTWLASGRHELLREACKGFGVSVSSAKGSQSRRLDRLERHLARVRKSDQHSVLIIDQAENLSTPQLAQVGMLIDLQNERGKLLTVVLVGQSHVAGALAAPEFSRLRQQLFGERTLRPLTLEQTGAYIRRRVTAAGRRGEELFDHDAIEWIHRRADGVPRLINHLCDRALIAAYGAGETRITLETLGSLGELSIEGERSADIATVGAGGGRAGAPVLSSDSTTTPSGEPSDVLNAYGDGIDTPDGPEPGAVFEAAPSHRAEVESVGLGDLEYATVPRPTTSGHKLFIGSMESLFARGETLLDRLEQAMARSDHMTIASESALAQQMAVEKHLSTLTDRAERLIRSADRVLPAAGKTRSRLQQDTGDTLSGIERSERAGAAESEEAIATFQKSIEERASALKETIDAAVQSAQAKLDDSLSRADAAVADVESHIAKSNEKLDEAVHRFDSLERTCQERMVAVCQSATEEHRAAFQRGIHEIVEAAKNRVHDSCAKASDYLAEAEARAVRSRSGLDDAVQQWEQYKSTFASRAIDELQSELQAAVGEVNGQVDALSRKVDIARCVAEEVTPRLDEAETQFVKLEARMAGQIALETAAAEKTVRELDEAVAATSNTKTAIESATQSADELVRKLDSHHAAASATLRSLAETTVSGRKTLDQTRVVTEAAKQQTGQLAATNTESRKTMERLEELARSGALANETLGTSLTRADEKANALASATKDAQEMLERSATGRERSRGFLVRADEVLAALPPLVERAETDLTELSSQTSRADKSKTLLDETVKAAQQVHEAIHEQTHRCDTLMEGISSRTRRADELVQRLGSIIDAAEEARHAEDVVRNVVDEARSVHSELSNVVSGAQQQVDELHQLAHSSHELAGTKNAMNADGERIVRRLGEHLDAANTFVEASETLLQDVINKTDSLQARVDRVGAALEERLPELERAVAEPDNAVERAKSQTAQLDKICKVVRKVASGLARSTLEARGQAAVLRDVNRESAARLSALTSLTQHASRTLQTWVEESVGMQTEIDRATTDAHAVDELAARDAAFRRTRQTVEQRVGEPACPGDLKRFSGSDDRIEKTVTASTVAPAHPRVIGATPKAGAHAAEIADLIEKAKRAEAPIGK